MSKLTDIKYRIDQMDGGEFQNLCDEYLTCRGYRAQYPFGMKTGTNKTAKGNPDTYFIGEDGRYIFAMYTTQDGDFVNKAIADLEKCFDASKTGLEPEKLEEIVYCHTYGRLSAGEAQLLRQYCEDRNTRLTLIGTDEIASDLYKKYPRLAADFLGISVDTGQILSTSEFVRLCDANVMSAPLYTEFLFREEELKSAKEKLCQSNVLVLTGPAGVGKTRLALDVCKELSEETGMAVLCVKNNGVEIYDDLIAAIEPDREYLVFVDDANELTELNLVLSFLPGGAFGHRCIKKLVLTVRDYAKQRVIQQILDVARPEILKIGLLKDGQIKQLVEKNYGIINYRFLDRIALIAEGNARLAMLAGKVAAEHDCLDAIRDATELYEHYYEKQLKSLAAGETWIISAGIMAFVHVLRLDTLERMQAVFQFSNLTREQFIADVHQLNQLELADLCHDTAVRMSDQCFSNYLLKYIFVDTKKISLSQMIEVCFFINKEKTIEACNTLLNLFAEKTVQEYIKEQIEAVWDRLRPEADRFIPFFRAFFPIRPTNTLTILNDLICETEQHDVDVRSIPFSKTKSHDNINDFIIEILGGFAGQEQLQTAVELLLLYYSKRPELFGQVYSAFITKLGANAASKSDNYYTQRTVVDCLCNALEENATEATQLLFVRVAEQFLKLRFSGVEGGRQNTFSYYTAALDNRESVLTYRKLLWEHLSSLYENGCCREEIESLLYEYGKDCYNDEDNAIVLKEMDAVVSILAFFQPEKLHHCIIAENIKKIAEHVKYDYGDRLIPFLESRKLILFNKLYANRSVHPDMDYTAYRSWRTEQIQKLVAEFDLDSYLFVFQLCKEAMLLPEYRQSSLASGIEIAINGCFERKELYVSVVIEYLKEDTPCDIDADSIFTNLFCIMPATSVKKLIDDHSFSQKNAWLWNFYTQLPDEQVSLDWFEDFLAYLELAPKKLRSKYERPLNKIVKYEGVDKDAVIKASMVIAAHYNDAPDVFGLYFSFILNPYYEKASTVIDRYKDNLALLEDIYLKYLDLHGDEDQDGEFLAELFCRDPDFLYCYLDKALDHMGTSFYAHNSWASRLHFVWDNETFQSYPELISDYLFEKTGEEEWRYSAIISQLLLCKNEDSDIVAKRQNAWILHTIEMHAAEPTRMHYLFGAISESSESSADRRRIALEKFLKLNDDYALFEKLPLESPSIGGIGSMIPYIQARIDYFLSLKPLLTGVKFLKHRQRIEQRIAYWTKQIKDEEIQELLDNLG